MTPFSARQLLALGFATVGSRILLALYLGVWGQPERWEYDVTATNIANGQGHIYDRSGFVYAAYAPPLWSYILAGLLRLPGSAHFSIQFLQAVLCLGSAVTYATLARRVSGNTTAGMVAGFLVALQPSLLYYSVVKSDPLPFNVLVLGFVALAAAGLVESPDPRRAAGFGLLLALGVLSRGTPIVGLPLMAVWLVARWGRHASIPIAVMSTTLALGLAPWLIRNERLLGRALITSTAGENFWRGNHEGATGGVLDTDGGRITNLTPTNKSLPATIRSVLQNGTELERQDIFMSKALSFIREKPGSAAHLFARKMRTFWWKIESDPRDYSPAASLAYHVSYWTELAFALLGAFAMFRAQPGGAPRPDRMAAGLAIALMFAISVLQSAFYVQGRHRFLIEPLLLMFTACGVLEIVRTRPGAWKGTAVVQG